MVLGLGYTIMSELKVTHQYLERQRHAVQEVGQREVDGEDDGGGFPLDASAEQDEAEEITRGADHEHQQVYHRKNHSGQWIDQILQSGVAHAMGHRDVHPDMFHRDQMASDGKKRRSILVKKKGKTGNDHITWADQ